MLNTNTKKSWDIFDYEVMMFRGIHKYKSDIIFEDTNINKIVHSALTESLILHIRILAGIILSLEQKQDDITLKKILPDYESNEIEILRKLYGSNTDINSPHWQFNKLLAHATTKRSKEHDYTDVVVKLSQMIEKILNDITEFRTSTEHQHQPDAQPTSIS